ncbi:unnamed protein product [Cladocopium goreaui]|uniref:ABC transporter G family member 24 n=1 Tax=Cladocopium goreaui TaxID=2562237 RepID=A0A9P1DUR5_9DINO|nr:unnamed protein product [Cladocopium goreaui]
MKYNYKPTYVDRKHHFADCVTWPSPPQPLLAPGKRNAKDVPADTHGNVVRLQLGDVTDAEAMLPVLLICLLWPALAEASLLQTAVKRPVIPCVIHQTAKRHQLQENESLWAETWRAKNPQCKYKLWNDTEIAQLARTRSPALMWPIWEGLTPVQRADVFRYLVLWDQGGYYADVDAACTLPIDQYKIPKEASMIVGYEMGHRLKEKRRAEIKFARMEQFQQWFLASAPGNPVLLRCMELIRQRYTWKIESTLGLTGPGVFSDAVQEFLQQDDHRAVEEEVRIRRTPKVHFLSYPSETLYGSGLWKMWLLAAGRAKVSAMVAREDPGEAPQNLVKHYFAGSWKTAAWWTQSKEKDFESRRASV